MAISERLKGFLAQAKVRYTVAKHPVVYTAQEIAASQHVPGRQLAKSVLVKTDQGLVLAVLPAIHLIDFKKLKAVVKSKSVSIAKESDIRAQFPDIEVGAMSPFGNLYQVPVVVDRGLAEAPEIVFNAGTHTETIKMAYKDFAALTKPASGAFGLPFAGSKPGKKKKGAKKRIRASKRPKKPAAKKKPAKKSPRRR